MASAVPSTTRLKDLPNVLTVIRVLSGSSLVALVFASDSELGSCRSRASWTAVNSPEPVHGHVCSRYSEQGNAWASVLAPVIVITSPSLTRRPLWEYWSCMKPTISQFKRNSMVNVGAGDRLLIPCDWEKTRSIRALSFAIASSGEVGVTMRCWPMVARSHLNAGDLKATSRYPCWSGMAAAASNSESRECDKSTLSATQSPASCPSCCTSSSHFCTLARSVCLSTPSRGGPDESSSPSSKAPRKCWAMSLWKGLLEHIHNIGEMPRFSYCLYL
jgi:hypothetical protein